MARLLLNKNGVSRFSNINNVEKLKSFTNHHNTKAFRVFCMYVCMNYYERKKLYYPHRSNHISQCLNFETRPLMVIAQETIIKTVRVESITMV